MRTRILAFLLAFLLLGLQQGAAQHALSHIGDALDRPQEQGLQLPADDTSCVICALFAGGSNAIASGNADTHQFAAASATPQVATPSPASSAPAWYLSRAPPPSLL